MFYRTIFLVTIFATIFSPVMADELDYKPDELIVRFAPKTNGVQRTKAERNAILISINSGSVKYSYKLVPGLTVVKLPPNRTVKGSLSAFENRPEILYAELNYKCQIISTTPNDTRFDDLWGMHKIDAPEAWDISTDAEDIIVAVLDTGVDYDHEDLAANMWVNPGEEAGDGNGDGKPGVAGVDDDGDGLIDEDSEGRTPGDPDYTNDLVNDDDENGYVDDIYGWNFADNDSNPNDYHGHGTHVAGTIGTIGNNKAWQVCASPRGQDFGLIIGVFV